MFFLHLVERSHFSFASSKIMIYSKITSVAPEKKYTNVSLFTCDFSIVVVPLKNRQPRLIVIYKILNISILK